MSAPYAKSVHGIEGKTPLKLDWLLNKWYVA